MTRFTLAYSFTPVFVRAVIGPGRLGAYALGHLDADFVPGYIGRSDCCLRDRLATHEQLGAFDYFIVCPSSSPTTAFNAECALWHACSQKRHHLENRVHPARPRGSGLLCPYCDFAVQAIRAIRAA
ncbi:MAG: hypothetical protein ACREMZ_11375 [Gemmatimonadales bacterium]